MKGPCGRQRGLRAVGLPRCPFSSLDRGQQWRWLGVKELGFFQAGGAFCVLFHLIQPWVMALLSLEETEAQEK